MAALPNPRIITCVEWLEMAQGIGVPEAGVVGPEIPLADGRLRTPALLAEGILKPPAIPCVQIDIARIWPD